MAKTLNKAEQKLLDQAVQEVETGMLQTKVLAQAKAHAGDNGDVRRSYVKLRYRQLRNESAKQQRKVEKMREQGSNQEKGLRQAQSRHGGNEVGSSSSEGSYRRREKKRSKLPAIVMAVLAIGFLGAVGVALFSAF